MNPSTYSNLVIDPFSAICKAQTGELPSSLSIKSYRHKRVGQQDALECEHSQSKRAQNVFCPSLAGKRDRVVRKRVLIHQESLLPSPSIITIGSIKPSSKPSTSTNQDTQEEVDRKNEYQFTPPCHCGIFLSPPRSLDTLTSELIRSENFTRSTHCLQPSKEETEAMIRSESYRRFPSAFSRAIVGGAIYLDLDNQDLRTIPDLQKLVKEFSPCPTSCLFLSNNQLTSSPFCQLKRICYFQGLGQLSLRSNQLTEIPEQIGQLKNLKLLNFAFNKLEFLPSLILKLTDCKLLLNGNPWLRPPLPLDSSSPPVTTLGNQTVQKFKWLSESQGFFYFSPPAKTLVPIDDSLSPPLPSLLETCIRKMCITKDLSSENETLIAHDNDHDLDHNYLYPPSSSTKSPHPSTELAAVLPDQIQKIIKHPTSYFYRCNLCTTKLVLKPGVLPHPTLAQTSPYSRHAFHFRTLGFVGLAPFPQPQPQPQPQPHTPDQKIELNHNHLIPICWNICSLKCCIEHLITT
ncbi:hypothetical protein PGT21_023319 [Puccinia graminis f. sp. tritici]|uniref:Leucine-rich repeat-containing protein 63 n=1 Tax=Puccinia graminis f. sp. tritici TaxID=56615 RepID=A0A5B0NYA9_PUCGR|nr:hypothetical protein PGT21_023319 [Puccinia graminis f. sp. tritici]